MKRPSKDLFNLINSLDTSEKRRFTTKHTRSSSPKQNKILQLFKLIDRQTDYDESKLLKNPLQLSYGKQFAAAKYYLYNQLLEHVASEKDHISNRLRNSINRIESLFDRALYTQATAELKSAKKMATDYEQFHILSELYQYWELSIALRTQDMNRLEQGLKDWNVVEIKNKNIREYVQLSYRMALLHSYSGVARDKKHQQLLSRFASDALIKNERRAITFTSQVIFHNVKGIYWESRGNKFKKYIHFKRIIELFDQDPAKKKIRFLNYTARLNNYMLAISDLEMYNELPAVLEKMKNAGHLAVTTREKALQFYYYNSNRLHYYAVTGKFLEPIPDLEILHKEYKSYESTLTPIERILLVINIYNLHFFTGDFKKCLWWINKIRNEISIQDYPDLQASLRMMYIVLHFEVESGEDLLFSLIKADRYFLSKRKRLFSFERILLSFFKKFVRVQPTDSERRELFAKVREKLKALQKDEFERNAFRYFDFLLWIDSNIENKTPAEIIQERIQNKRSVNN